MRLIDADALMKDNGLESATKYGNRSEKQRTQSYSTMMLYEIAEMIDEAPTIDAEPVKHGRWLRTNRILPVYTCSECNNSVPQNIFVVGCDFKFCPYCSAEMDLKDGKTE